MSEHMASVHASYTRAAHLENAVRFLKANPRCTCCNAKSTVIASHPGTGARVALCKAHTPGMAATKPAGNSLARMEARLRAAAL